MDIGRQKRVIVVEPLSTDVEDVSENLEHESGTHVDAEIPRSGANRVADADVGETT